MGDKDEAYSFRRNFTFVNCDPPRAKNCLWHLSRRVTSPLLYSTLYTSLGMGGFFTDEYAFCIYDPITQTSVTRGESLPICERGQIYQFFDVPIDAEAYRESADFGQEIELRVFRSGRIVYRGTLLPHFLLCSTTVGSAAGAEPWNPPFNDNGVTTDAYCSADSFHIEPRDERRAPYTNRAVRMTPGILSDYAFSTYNDDTSNDSLRNSDDAMLLEVLRDRRPCSQWLRYEIEYPLIVDFVRHNSHAVSLRRIGYALNKIERSRVTIGDPVPWATPETRGSLILPEEEIEQRLRLLKICA